MARAGKTFRVFVSSTFSDLKAERNALQEKVFPKLRELCMQHGCRFQAIDLRWGVSDEASVDQQAMPICMEELHRCQDVTPRPNFIVLLGQRYGWLPIPAYIDADEFKNILHHINDDDEKKLIKQWYKLDDNAVPAEYVLQPREGKNKKYNEWEMIEGDIHRILLDAARKADLPEEDLIKYERSATEQEILEGAFKAETDNAFCYFRTIDDLPEDKRAEDFRDFGKDKKQDQTAKDYLNNLKHRLNEHFPEEQIYDYAAKWSGDGVTDDHLDALCERVEANLREAIREEIESMERKTDLEQEIESHQDFCDDRARHFIGRKTITKKIMDYVQKGDNHPRVVYGPSGSGKSALMARCVQLVEKQNPDAVLIHRFIGATAASTDIRSLLESLCNQIFQVFKFEREKKRKLERITGSGEKAQEERQEIDEEYSIPSEMQKLPKTFKNFLTKIPVKKNLLLFLDALDQLSPSNNAHSLNWLPNELPENVRIVVSVLDREGAAGECLRKAKVKLPPESLIELKPLTVKEGEKLLDTWFKEAKRTLQDEQRADVLDKFKQCKLPLYLKLAFEEARRWHSYDGLPCGADDVPGLNADIEGVILDLLARLEKPANHGKVMVGKALGYLAAARYGLTEDEILEVLPQDETVFHDFFKRAFSIPTGIYDAIINLLTDDERETLGDEKPEQVLLANLSDDREFCDDILVRSQREKIALRLPVVIWSRLYHDLEPYFTERAADETSLMSFYHRQFGEVITAKYASGDEKVPLHKGLASHFYAQEHEFVDEDGKKVLNYRKMSELPYQLTHGEVWGGLEAVLTDLDFVDAKSKAGMVYDLISDYNFAMWSMPEGAEKRKKEEKRQEIIKKYTDDLIAHAKNPDKVPLPDPPPAVDIVKSKPDTDRKRDWTPFEGVNAWSHFVSQYPQWLGKDIPPAYQFAWNFADGGPVIESIENRPYQLPWLRLIYRPLYNPEPACLKTLEGHILGVFSVALTPDGKRAVSGSQDGTLRVWDVETGECLKTLEGHTDYVYSVALTPGGKRAVSGSEDKTVRVWDVETGECLKTLKGHTKFVYSVALTPEGKRAVSGSRDKTVCVWDVETGECLKTLEGHTNYVKSVALTPDGKRAVSGSWDKTLRVWDVETGECLKIIKGHTGGVTSVVLTLDGKRAVSGSVDNTLRVWDVETGECLKTLEGHADYVYSVALTPDGKRAVSGSLDKTVRVWDVETGECLKTIEGHTFGVKSVVLTPDGKRAVSGSEDKTVRVWDVETHECLKTLEGQYGRGESVALTHDGKHAVSGGKYDATLRVWDVETGECLKKLEGHTLWVTSVALTPDGKRAVSGSDDKTVRVWDVETGECLKTLEGHTDWVRSVALTLDGKRAVSGSKDYTLRVWDVETGECLKTLEGVHGVESFALTPDGKRAVSGSYEKINVWDVETGECLKTLEGHNDLVLSVVLTPDGKRAVSGSRDKTVCVWDVETGECLAIFPYDSPVGSVALSNDISVIGTISGTLALIQINNLPIGPPILTAWHSDVDGTYAFRCTLCRKWLEIPESALGTELPCPKCGKAVKLDPFTINADWRPIAEGWGGDFRSEPSAAKCPPTAKPLKRLETGTEHRSIKSPPRREPKLTPPATIPGIETRGYKVNREAIRDEIKASGSYRGKDSKLAAKLNKEYQEALAQWKSLPWRKRLFIKRPKRPNGI